MTGYTKGPWTVTFSKHVRVRPTGSNSPICGVHKRGKYTGSLNLRETEANARLIAAAPELAEALKNTLQFAEACHRDCDDALMRQAIGMDIMSARAALKKAGVE